MAKSDKYRVHELAKDFGLPSKKVMEILTMYGAKPKNHMQPLSDHDLSIVFEYLTQHNQVPNVQAIFAELQPEDESAEPSGTVQADSGTVQATSGTVENSPANAKSSSTAADHPAKGVSSQNSAARAGHTPNADNGTGKAVGNGDNGTGKTVGNGDNGAGKAVGNGDNGTGKTIGNGEKSGNGTPGTASSGGRRQEGSAGTRQISNTTGARPDSATAGTRQDSTNTGTRQISGTMGTRQISGSADARQISNTTGARQDSTAAGVRQDSAKRPDAVKKPVSAAPRAGIRPGAKPVNTPQPVRQQSSATPDSASVRQNAGSADHVRPSAPKPSGSISARPGSRPGANPVESRPVPPKDTKVVSPREGGSKSGEGAATSKQAEKPVRTPSRVPQKKIVDTRKGGDVNLAKYDEHLEDLGGQRGERMQQKGGKQKIRNASQRRSGGQNLSSKRRQDEAERMRRLQLEIAKKAPVKVQIPDEISVGELASRMKKSAAEVVKCLMKNGVMASVSQFIDFDTAAIIAEEMGCKVEKEIVVTIEEKLIDVHEDKEEELQPRAPVVVVMGHVDHGKTTLLDTIRNTSVAAGEAGGITQHIGAYQVEINGKSITFLDTPGHEAFTSMRARGAMITDIAILMVAADDGIMPQTVESINHAKAANIPIIVAVNKIDKDNANPDRVLQQLTEHGLVPEEWGGDTICCRISAKKKIGIENLLEMVILTAEMEELRANPNRAGQGTVIEARLDKGRGPVATLLVQNGTLKQGDIIIAGTAVGRVRAMVDYRGNRLTEAGPSVPVEITGLSEAPGAGSPFFAVADERMARALVEQRKSEERAKAAAPVQKVSLENLFDQIQAGERKELALIVKADVQGSVEAIQSSLEKLSNDEVNVRVIHGAAGAINESDVMLAASSNAIIIGFNVRPDATARDDAARQNVDMRMYRVIYDCIGEIEAAMKGMLAPKYREVVLGHAEVRKIYHVSGVGTVAGCYVQSGKIQRNCQVRVVRDGIVVHEGTLASLKRFKDDVREVAENYECGMTVEKFNDIKEGDQIEGFVMEEIPR